MLEIVLTWFYFQLFQAFIWNDVRTWFELLQRFADSCSEMPKHERMTDESFEIAR